MRRNALPQLSPTERPSCPKCQNRMDLRRIEPGIRGYENRVFECGRCYTMKAVPAVADRMKSPSPKGTEAL
jgi:ribosomal protein L37AE/L43A